MRHMMKTMLLLTLVASFAPHVLAKSAVHIDRQCYRYSNFCGAKHDTQRATKVYKASKATAKAYKSQKSVVAHPAYRDSEPFIERQCTRYGHFC